MDVEQIMGHMCDDYYASAAELLAAGMNEGIPVLAILQFTNEATVHDIYATLKTIGDDHFVARVGVSHEADAAEQFEALARRMGAQLTKPEDRGPTACDHR